MSARAKTFDFNGKTKTWDFGTYALLLYYAKQLDGRKGKQFFDATQSEYHYRIRNNISLVGITENDDVVHFNVTDLNELIIFFDSILIPALANETMDLIEKFGGRKKFCDLFESETGYLESIGLDDDNEYFESDPENLILYMQSFILLLQEAIASDRPYEVWVD
jgi:hypothetical protein